jgi:hypothetical protein
MTTFENEKFKLVIENDEFPTNPRENDNFSEMICFHNRYILGDVHNYQSNDFNGWDEMKKEISKSKNPAIILPLYLYDHSGITISTYSFGCRWDSGQVGYVLVTKEKVYSEYKVKRISRKLMKKLNSVTLSEVDEYDNYLTGDVYTFNLLNKITGEEDSCCGFYGSDIKKNGMLDYIGIEAENSLAL